MTDGLLGTAMFFLCQGLVTVEALKNMIPSLKYFHDTTLNKTSV